MHISRVVTASDDERRSLRYDVQSRCVASLAAASRHRGNRSICVMKTWGDWWPNRIMRWDCPASERNWLPAKTLNVRDIGLLAFDYNWCSILYLYRTKSAPAGPNDRRSGALAATQAVLWRRTVSTFFQLEWPALSVRVRRLEDVSEDSTHALP